MESGSDTEGAFGKMTIAQRWGKPHPTSVTGTAGQVPPYIHLPVLLDCLVLFDYLLLLGGSEVVELFGEGDVSE